MLNTNIEIFIINLEQDIVKKIHMENISKIANLSFTFINAIYGKELSIDTIKTVYDREVSTLLLGRELGVGEIGCALSHISIYKHIVENNIEYALILEDDVKFESGFLDVFQSVSSFPKNWEVMLFGHNSEIIDNRNIQKSIWKQKKITPQHKSVRLVNLAHGTYGYMINLQGAKKLLSALEMITKPVDHYTGVDTFINLYAISPRIVVLDEKFKDKSNLLIERQNNQSTFKKKTPLLINILSKIGLYRSIKKIRDILKKIKPLKRYY